MEQIEKDILKARMLRRERIATKRRKPRRCKIGGDETEQEVVCSCSVCY